MSPVARRLAGYLLLIKRRRLAEFPNARLVDPGRENTIVMESESHPGRGWGEGNGAARDRRSRCEPPSGSEYRAGSPPCRPASSVGLPVPRARPSRTTQPVPPSAVRIFMFILPPAVTSASRVPSGENCRRNRGARPASNSTAGGRARLSHPDGISRNGSIGRQGCHRARMVGAQVLPLTGLDVVGLRRQVGAQAGRFCRLVSVSTASKPPAPAARWLTLTVVV